MRDIIKYRFSVLTLLVILLCMFFFTKCINNERDKTVSSVPVNYAAFAGSASCMNCHKSIYDTHINTAHFLTSAVADEKNIKGSFDTGKNKFVYNSGAMVAMEKQAHGFYQVAYINNIEKKSQRFDMVIGSGTKGQSFASWTGNHLFQLPITYFTSENQWSNSPGYPNKIAFNRPITSRCLECHATFAEKISSQGIEPEAFNKNAVIMGVDCEKCHGPAAKHVEFQTQNPKEPIAKFIINPAKFSRQQSLDMCALCHGGRLQKTKPSFEFVAGNKLSDYFLIDSLTKDVNSIDVHGNQYGLLKASKCFLKSNTLTCNTCHNPHVNEKGNVKVFSQRCISCHNDKHADAVLCKMTATLGAAINNNCINCHMPEQPSMAIAVMLQGSAMPTPALMHTHLVKTYPDETKKVLAFIKNNK
jgi:nitrate/TMAO reductase-like tetraheme cytochrome c subunit